MTKEKIMSWLLTHAGVENENSRELIYNTLVLKIGAKELLAELSEVKELVTDEEIIKGIIAILKVNYSATNLELAKRIMVWLRFRLQPAQSPMTDEFWKQEYDKAIKEIGNLQNQLKDTENAIKDN